MTARFDELSPLPILVALMFANVLFAVGDLVWP